MEERDKRNLLVPPQARPAQPTVLGATIWSRMSKLPAVALSGMAKR